MTKAEQAANKAYPPKIEEHPKVMGGTITFDSNRQPREFFRQGYQQAERDLADAFQAEYAKELARADLALTIEAARELVESVEKYIRQEELRSQLLIKKENLKKLL